MRRWDDSANASKELLKRRHHSVAAQARTLRVRHDCDHARRGLFMMLPRIGCASLGHNLRGKPVLVQELSRHAINVVDHPFEVPWFRVVAKDELRLLPQVVRHIWPRPHLSKDVARKSQGPRPLVWHRHDLSSLVGCRRSSLTHQPLASLDTSDVHHQRWVECFVLRRSAPLADVRA